MKGILADDLRQYIIRPALQTINAWSLAAENLLLGTAAQESQLGHYLAQRNGPALGLYQIEPATHLDIWQNYLSYRAELTKQVLTLCGAASKAAISDNLLITNLVYATAIARLIYQRVPAPLPPADDVERLAQYWKQYYNTPMGKGTAEEFIQHYQQYVQ